MSLSNHVIMHSNNKIKVLSKFCELELSSQGSLKKHIKRKHKGENFAIKSEDSKLSVNLEIVMI